MGFLTDKCTIGIHPKDELEKIERMTKPCQLETRLMFKDLLE